MKTILRLSIVALVCVGVPIAQAGVFTIDTDVSGNRASASFSSVEDTFNSLNTAQLRAINSAYTGIQAATIAIGYRGLPMIATYPTAGSSLLVFSVPALGISQSFSGATRDESQRLLGDYFKNNVGDILSRLSKELAKSSPVDPIAGNPNSLMSQLVMQDFNNSFTSFATNIKAGGGGQSSNLIGIGFGMGNYRQAGITSRSYTIPLSYTFRNDLDPRQQIAFNVPITLVDTEGSKSYYVGLGGSYRFPVNDNWALTPAANLALAGSADLGALASVASASLTSSYYIPMESFDLAIGNMVGYYTTLKVASGGYSYDPGISNTVLRNGIMLSHPVTVGGRKMSLEYSFSDTRFFGDALFVDQFNEVGVSLGTNKRAASSRSYFKSGVSYLHSPQSKGFSFNLGYWF